MGVLFAFLITLLVPVPPLDAGAAPAIGCEMPRTLPRHDFHVVYGRMGIEGNVVQVRLRFFADDLTEGLRAAGAGEDFTLAVDSRSDSLVTAYVNARFVVSSGTSGQQTSLKGSIAASGEEVDQSESVWWYVFSYRAAAPVRSLIVRNSLLTEVYDDQRNILRVQHFPSEKQQTFYLTGDDPEARFSL